MHLSFIIKAGGYTALYDQGWWTSIGGEGNK